MADNRHGGHSPGNRINREAGDQRGRGSQPVISGPAGHREEDYQREHPFQARPYAHDNNPETRPRSPPSHAHAHTFEDRVPSAPILHPALREDKRRAEEIGVSINSERDSATPDWSGTAKLDLADRR